eukprot:1317114-Amphidinium_carterae.1
MAVIVLLSSYCSVAMLYLFRGTSPLIIAHGMATCTILQLPVWLDAQFLCALNSHGRIMDLIIGEIRNPDQAVDASPDCSALDMCFAMHPACSRTLHCSAHMQRDVRFQSPST